MSDGKVMVLCKDRVLGGCSLFLLVPNCPYGIRPFLGRVDGTCTCPKDRSVQKTMPYEGEESANGK